MKKKIYGILISVMLMISMCGCGDDKEEQNTSAVNPIQADVVEFVNEELPAITSDRNTAVEIYNSYFSGVDLNMDLFLNDLNNTAIPAMERFIANLQSIQVSTTEVEQLKNTYLLAAQKQHEAMKLVALAIEGETPEYLTQADSLIEEAQTYMLQYEIQLTDLATANGIIINGVAPSNNSVEDNATTQAQ